MTQSTSPARVRFAPSPTGRTHLGSGRTALYNFLLARQTAGQFILRIEDTDQKRYVPGAEQELMESLRWLGVDWDAGPDCGGPDSPYRQSERKEIYQDIAKELIDQGDAYYCFCTPDRLAHVRKEQQKRKEPPRYDGLCRRLTRDEAQQRVDAGESHVIRFKMPQAGTVTCNDLLRGDIVVENKNLDDYIIVKSDGLALYHLAAIVDDHLMRITHVLRGSEWLSTFPLHVHIYQALGWQQPIWVHLSVFLKPSGKGKMSKRESAALIKDGFSVFLNDLRELGYLPEAVANWVALMGWSFDDHTEFFTMDSLIENFSLDRLNPSPAAINFSKLDHFNGLHIRSLTTDDLARRIEPFFNKAGYPSNSDLLLQIAPIIQERITTLDDAPEIAGFFFKSQVHPIPEELIGKNMTPAESAEAARQAGKVLESLPDISPESAEQPLRDLADQLEIKAGQLFGILRSAVTGQRISPPLLESMQIIGKDIVLKRIEQAAIILDEMS